MSQPKRELRLRVFVGPNGSGKSTIIKAIKDTVIDGFKLDMGTYINADDIAQALIENKFSFSKYKTHPTKKEIIAFAEESGLLNREFSRTVLDKMFNVLGDKIHLVHQEYFQNLAQLIARFLR